MAHIQVLSEFKKNLISFFDELIDLLPNESDLYMIRLFLDNQMPIQDVMDIFNYNLNKDDQKLRKIAKDRNDTFFIDNDPFGLNERYQSSANHLKEIWRSPRLDANDRKTIWSWIDAFIFLGDKYSKSLQQNNTKDEVKEDTK